MQVANFFGVFWRLTWKAPQRSRSLVTQYQVTYTNSDARKVEKWTKRDQRSLDLKFSARNPIHAIEVRPYCGELLKGPGLTKNTESLATAAAAPPVQTDAISCGWIMLMNSNGSKCQPGGVAAMSDGRLLVTDIEKNCLRLSTATPTIKGIDVLVDIFGHLLKSNNSTKTMVHNPWCRRFKTCYQLFSLFSSRSKILQAVL